MRRKQRKKRNDSNVGLLLDAAACQSRIVYGWISQANYSALFGLSEGRLVVASSVVGDVADFPFFAELAITSVTVWGCLWKAKIGGTENSK